MDNIPDELVDALNKPYGYSILVKGIAGTGKTTLVLELLSRSENPLYFSTRVSPLSLKHQFPWIEEKIKPENMLDVTQLSYISTDTEQYFESIVRFKDLPEFLQVIYQKTKNLENPFVVIDAWSTLLKYSQSSSIIEGKIESFLSEMVRQKKIKLFLVTETENETYLDYIVDGIITLKRVGFGQRFGKKRIRELHIEKLRGVPIKQHEYIFTLNNGRFRHFEPQNPLQKKGSFHEIPDPEGRFSSGNPQLDSYIGGGYKMGSFIIFEIGDAVSDIFDKILIYQTILNFLKHGRSCSIIPEAGEHALRFFQDLVPIISEETFNENVRIYEEKHEFLIDDQPYIKYVSGDDLIKDLEVYKKVILELKQKSSNGHYIQFISGIDALESRYPLEIYLPIQNRNVESIQIGNDLDILCLKKGSKMKQTVLNQCDYHFVLCSINGCVILEIVKPFHKYPLAMEVDFPNINLIPII